MIQQSRDFTMLATGVQTDARLLCYGWDGYCFSRTRLLLFHAHCSTTLLFAQPALTFRRINN